MTRTLLSLLLLTAIASTGSASSCECAHDAKLQQEFMETHPDRVYELPGWNQPLPTRFYSGYLDYEFHGQQVHTHYVLLEAEQVGDCTCDKPLIYWVRDSQ